MEFKPIEADVVCQYCDHPWQYSGQTPYAQCPKCMKSNNLKELL